MKKQVVFALALSMVLSAMGGLAACGEEKPAGKTEGLTDTALTGETLVDYSAGKPSEKVQFASNGWSNGGGFDTLWDASQVTYSDGQMHLGLAENPTGSTEKNDKWLGGEARTTYYYGYGDFEVRMKISPSVGTASTFFVCTGPYDVWPDGTENPWDEIDIEFLGKDPTKVQFNYFVNGQGSHEYMYKLGFDASKEFHNYGFRWAENYITWFVDGKPVYRIDKPEGGDLPKAAGRILANYWAGVPGEAGGGTEAWMGRFTGADGNTADYEWIKTSAQKVNPPQGDPYESVDPENPPAGGELDWSKTESLALGFTSAQEYTVAPAADGKSAQITYSGVTTSYHNVEMDVTAAAADKNAMHLKIKNNGTSTVNVRLNLVNDEKLDANAQNSAVNKSATQDGAAVRTDLDWGGSYFDIEAGKEAECVVLYEGVANKLQLMIDSAIYGNTEAKSGDVTVSDLKFASAGESGTPSAPEAKELAFASTEEYTVDPAGTPAGSVNVTYSAVGGRSYKNITANVATFAAGNNTFTVKIKNNSSEPVRVRVDVQGTTRVDTSGGDGSGSGTDACNLSASCTGGSDCYTDTTWGGTFVTVGAGEEVTLVITYDGNGAQGAVQNILIYLDSSRNDDETHSGNVTLSGFAFGKQG